MGEEEEDYNAAAREIMAVVYHLLPKPYRKKADYLAKAGKDMDNVRFYFRTSSHQSWQFDMDTAHPWIRSEAAGRRNHISEPDDGIIPAESG